ncbi:hypothetical protein OROMI_024646 [Orobanche minor]
MPIVKSLSKGNNSKKDVSFSYSMLRESTVQPLTSIQTQACNLEDDTGDSFPEQPDKEECDDDFYEHEKISWNKNTKVEKYSFLNMDDKTKRANGQAKLKEPPKSEMKHSDSGDDLNALLKEEEDLVCAHRKQVEETMDIVREVVGFLCNRVKLQGNFEMNLLVGADQPGNQLDSYISKLNTILSQKADGILQLQNRLARFQKHLKEHNVLASSG